jgi:hypothetical protein
VDFAGVSSPGSLGVIAPVFNNRGSRGRFEDASISKRFLKRPGVRNDDFPGPLSPPASVITAKFDRSSVCGTLGRSGVSASGRLIILTFNGTRRAVSFDPGVAVQCAL